MGLRFESWALARFCSLLDTGLRPRHNKIVMSMNEPAFRTEGVIDSSGHIEANGLPFDIGQRVQLVVWAAGDASVEGSATQTSPGEIKRRRQAFDELLQWNREHLKNLPVLSDQAMSRESIYEDRL